MAKRGIGKRDCPTHLVKKKGNPSSVILPIIDISLALAASNAWVLDTACPSHICNVLQDLRVTSRPRKGEIQLRVGNGDSLDVETIGTFCLNLPNSCNIILNDCYFVPGLVRQIISLSVLDREGYCMNIQNGSLYLYDCNNILLTVCHLNNGIIF